MQLIKKTLSVDLQVYWLLLRKSRLRNELENRLPVWKGNRLRVHNH